MKFHCSKKQLEYLDTSGINYTFTDIANTGLVTVKAIPKDNTERMLITIMPKTTFYEIPFDSVEIPLHQIFPPIKMIVHILSLFILLCVVLSLIS